MLWILKWLSFNQKYYTVLKPLLLTLKSAEVGFSLGMNGFIPFYIKYMGFYHNRTDYREGGFKSVKRV